MMNAPDKSHDKTKIFSGEVHFIRPIINENELPIDQTIEIAFAGRSNVGKSSLINGLLGRNGIARTSRTPGRTQAIHLYGLGKPQYEPHLANAFPLRLIDMPGYGYAKVPQKMIAGWTKLIHHYLRGRVNLRRVNLLIDARHGLKPKDKEIMQLLDEAAVSTRLVLTKCDKISAQAQAVLKEKIALEIATHPSLLPEAFLTSSEKKIGLDLLRADLIDLL